ncbi:PREDICTED: transmembrane protein 69 isoform X2 [Thamnophis sirtalis]|nr:PREDICTED: transmembrane protein 69 isoform X2 [Thamnophis sirtalis]XP_013917394.1 PREDICTED: transmembrane protein 69 isoform X2 [Thamnophis sirtalis]
MFRFIQQCGFQIPSKLQTIHLQRFLQPRNNFCSVPLKYHQSFLSKLQLSKKASLCTTKIQGFHSSACNWNSKRPSESTSDKQDPGLFDLASLKDSPKPAIYVAASVLFPFVSVPLTMAIQKASYPELAFAEIAYAASILSFLGGIRWGFTLLEGSPAKPDWRNLGNSIVPPLLAWITLLLKDLTTAGIMVIIGLMIALNNDLVLLPTYPNWFKALLVILTLVAAFATFVTLIYVNFYPERYLSFRLGETENSK